MKKAACLAASFFVLFCFASSASLAEEGKEELMAKLRDLRHKKVEMENEYDANLHNVDKEAEDRIMVIKSDFRKAREECLANKHKKSTQLRKDYEARLKPILKEERDLAKQIGRDAMEDFAKMKVKRRI